MDASLALYLMAALGVDTPILEALSASLNAMDPLAYFKARLYAEFRLDLDIWGELEPGSSVVFPLDSARTKQLQVVFTHGYLGLHYAVNFYCLAGFLTFNVTRDTSRAEIDDFLKTMRMYLPYYEPQ